MATLDAIMSFAHVLYTLTWRQLPDSSHNYIQSLDSSHNYIQSLDSSHIHQPSVTQRQLQQTMIEVAPSEGKSLDTKTQRRAQEAYAKIVVSSIASASNNGTATGRREPSRTLKCTDDDLLG